jgi:metal-responsive CopG/Arc/MetJ family transcriptional regulator
MKGRTRRVPISVHAPLDTLEAIDEFVQNQGGSYSRSDFYEEAAQRFLRQLGRLNEEGERTIIVPEISGAQETVENTGRTEGKSTS